MAKIDVAPLAGARIEIGSLQRAEWKYIVAPLAGARIEITAGQDPAGDSVSLPSRERGLKYGICVRTI